MKCESNSCDNEATWVGTWKHPDSQYYLQEYEWCDGCWRFMKGDHTNARLLALLATEEDFWKETWS